MTNTHKLILSLIFAASLIAVGLVMSARSHKVEAQGQFACEYCYDVFDPYVVMWRTVCGCEWVNYEDAEGCANYF